MLSQVFVYVCSNVWTWYIGNSQFFLFKAADTCICCCFGASAPGNLGWKHLYLLWGPRHLYLFKGPRYLNLGSHLTLQSLVPLVHLDVVQLELLLITDHLQRNSIIIEGHSWSISIDITQHCKKNQKTLSGSSSENLPSPSRPANWPFPPQSFVGTWYLYFQVNLQILQSLLIERWRCCKIWNLLRQTCPAPLAEWRCLLRPLWFKIKGSQDDEKWWLSKHKT